MSQAAPFVVVLVVAGVVGFLAYRYQEHQKQKMRAVAARAGLEVDVSRQKPPALDFDLFDVGSSKKMKGQMWRAGEADRVFQYQYTVKSGENSSTYEFTVALVAVPFRAPHLSISTENWWSKMKRVVGLRDIEIESSEFNDRYHVRCNDERFAITLLDPPMIAWMLSPSSGAGTVTFEFEGGWMLCHCKQLRIEELPAMLAWAQAARGQLPIVLTELYG